MINISTEPMINLTLSDVLLMVSFQLSFIDKLIFWDTV